MSDNTHSHTETLYHYWRAVVQPTLLKLCHWLPVLKHPQPLSCVSQLRSTFHLSLKSHPLESQAWQRAGGEDGTTLGGRGLGGTEAERGFHYINPSATVANHRLPLSHHSTFQPFCSLSMSWLVIKSLHILSLNAKDQCKMYTSTKPEPSLTTEEDRYYTDRYYYAVPKREITLV